MLGSEEKEERKKAVNAILKIRGRKAKNPNWKSRKKIRMFYLFISMTKCSRCRS